MSSRRPVTEFMMFFTFDFSGLTPGSYAIETIIKDSNSDKTINMTTPITVVQ
jgi:uncharacterized protein (DUF2141 family)